MCFLSSNRKAIDARADFLNKRRAYSEAARVADCEKHQLIFYKTEDATVKLVPRHCGSYWCPVCGPKKMALVKSKVQKVIESLKRTHLRFVTFTHVDHPGESLESAGNRFRKSFDKFRRRTWWKRHTFGYYVKYEATWNSNTKAWHYHAHVLAHSFYMKVEDLRAEWMKTSSGAFIQDIRAIDDNAAEELSKYVTRLKNRKVVPLSELTDYMHSHRMYAVAGSLKKYFANSEDIDDVAGFEFVGRLSIFLDNIEQSIFIQSTFDICYYLSRLKATTPNAVQESNDPALDYILRWEEHLPAKNFLR